MSSSIVPLSLFCEMLILGALGAAIASPRMSSPARPAVATFAFVCAWLETAVYDGIRAPAWTIFLGVAVIALSLAVVAITLHAWTQQSHGGEGEAGDDGPGGSGSAPPSAPQDGDSDPSWWPEFERKLASYTAAAEARKHALARSGPRD